MAESARRPALTAGEAVEAISAALHTPHISSPRPPVVLIDGRSGAGKSTLANLALERVPEAAIIRLDDVYPGWHGLAAARQHLYRVVLHPLAEGLPARWQRWDWKAGAAAGWTEVDPASPLIVEGVGAVSAATRHLADLAVWIDLDTDQRRQRALERDGDLFAPHWDQWARDEDVFVAAEHPRDHADLIVDGRTITG